MAIEFALFALLILAAYLLGAVPAAYLAAKWSRGIDIRQYGSGNVGAANVFAALDTPPAPWLEGPSTTVQSWDFNTEAADPTNVAPDGDIPTVNPNGDLSLNIVGATGFPATALYLNNHL